MANTLLFYLAPAIQQNFIDKDTQAPLVGGEIWFYRDKARTVLKPVFKLVGAPDNPSFEALPNPLPIGSAGSPVDPFDGSQVAIYYNPFDVEGDKDQYFIEVYSAPGKVGGVLQLTRESYPDVDSEADDTDVIINYISNPRFIVHKDVAPDFQVPIGVEKVFLDYSSAYKDKAHWEFVRNSGSTSVDFIEFVRIGSFVEEPEKSPRYWCRVETTVPDAGDTKKDLEALFQDVNSFASSTDEFTLQFTGESLTGGNVEVEFLIEKFFGVGGSATTETPITTFDITPGINLYTISFVFGDNETKTIGPNDDDFVGLKIRTPVDVIFNVQFTDFILKKGNFTVLEFPYVSREQQISQNLGGQIPIPQYDGTDNGKFLSISETKSDSQVQNESFLKWDSPVPPGSIITFGSENAPEGFLQCDGSNIDLFSEIKPTFSMRLFNAIGFRWGVGSQTYQTPAPIPAGATATIISSSVGAPPAPDTGTMPGGFSIIVTTAGNATTFEVLTVTWVAGSLFSGGEFFKVYSAVGPRANIFWYSVDGSGTAPTAGNDLIQEIPILSTDTAEEVKDKTLNLLDTQFKIPDLRGVFVRGWSSEKPFDYLFNVTINNGGSGYAVNDKLKLAGGTPVIPAIVEVTSVDGGGGITGVSIFIKGRYTAPPPTPDTPTGGSGTGAILNIDTRLFDPDEANRASWPTTSTDIGDVDEVIGSRVGSYELSELISHSHTFDNGTGIRGAAPDVAYTTGSPNVAGTGFLTATDLTGGLETRPINVALMYIIKT